MGAFFRMQALDQVKLAAETREHLRRLSRVSGSHIEHLGRAFVSSWATPTPCPTTSGLSTSPYSAQCSCTSETHFVLSKECRKSRGRPSSSPRWHRLERGLLTASETIFLTSVPIQERARLGKHGGTAHPKCCDACSKLSASPTSGCIVTPSPFWARTSACSHWSQDVGSSRSAPPTPSPQASSAGAPAPPSAPGRQVIATRDNHCPCPGLRQTAASAMLSAGVPAPVAARQLRDASSAITTTVYEHLLSDTALDFAVASVRVAGSVAGTEPADRLKAGEAA